MQSRKPHDPLQVCRRHVSCIMAAGSMCRCPAFGERVAPMPVSPEKRIAANSSVLIRTFADGESVLLNLDTENYFGLNAVGSRMWELLTSAASIEEAYQALLAEYEVTPDELRRDLDALIEQLVEHQLVEVYEP